MDALYTMLFRTTTNVMAQRIILMSFLMTLDRTTFAHLKNLAYASVETLDKDYVMSTGFPKDALPTVKTTIQHNIESLLEEIEDLKGKTN